MKINGFSILTKWLFDQYIRCGTGKKKPVTDWCAHYRRIQKVIIYSKGIWKWPSHICVPVIVLRLYLSVQSFVGYRGRSNGSGNEDQSYGPRCSHSFTHSANKYLLSAYHRASSVLHRPDTALHGISYQCDLWGVTSPPWVSCSPSVKWWQIYLYHNYENSMRNAGARALQPVDCSLLLPCL